DRERLFGVCHCRGAHDEAATEVAWKERLAHALSWAATRSQIACPRSSLLTSSTEVLDPSAPRIVAVLCSAPNVRFSPTWLTTIRSQPLAASFARPFSSTSFVSAAKPTIT